MKNKLFIVDRQLHVEFYFDNHKNDVIESYKFVKIDKLSGLMNAIFVDGKAIRVSEMIQEDFDFADEIIFATTAEGKEHFLKNYPDLAMDARLSFFVVKYGERLFTYDNKQGLRINIYRSPEDSISSYRNDIPFMMEPLLSVINKSNSDSYYTYSSATTMLSEGVYFDEDNIWREKGYDSANKDINVIIFGKNGTKGFIEESKMLYEFIYTSKDITLCEDIEKYDFDMDANYLLLSSDFRMISPFCVMYYQNMGVKLGIKGRIGLLSPKRLFLMEDIKLLYGNGQAITEFMRKKDEFSSEQIWRDYVMKKSIVADRENFNYIDLNENIYSIEREEDEIRMLEWISDKSNLRIDFS